MIFPVVFSFSITNQTSSKQMGLWHYGDVILGATASQTPSLTIVYPNVYSGADQKKTSKLRVTGFWAGNSPVTSEFPAQRASNAENVVIWWRHHESCYHWYLPSLSLNKSTEWFIFVHREISYMDTYVRIWLLWTNMLPHSRTRATFETPKYPRRPWDQYTAQIINTLELSAPPPNRGLKKLFNLVISLVKFQTTNTYVATKKMVALWKSQFMKQSSDLKTSSIPLRCHWKPKCQRRSNLSLVTVLLIPFVRHVHLHQYSWFCCIPSAVANRYRKSASLLKCSVSITTIS